MLGLGAGYSGPACQRASAAGEQETDMTEPVTDPVCQMVIDPADAAASEEHEGQTFYFCSHQCHETFKADPHRYGHPAS